MPEQGFDKMLEAIQNKELRVIVKSTIREKYDNTSYESSTGEIVSMVPDHRVEANLRAYCAKLIAWAINPGDKNSGNQGYGFALLMTHVLRHYISEETGLEVIQSPARLDFEKYDHGDTADIVVAGSENGLRVPQILIESKITSVNSTGLGFSRLLGMPVVPLNGDELFEYARLAILKKFAEAENPVGYANSLVPAFRTKLDALIK